MSVKVAWVCEQIEKLAPKEYALDWDNVGLLLGGMDYDVEKILVALDLTQEVLEEALAEKADMIVTHHNLIFKPIPSVTEENPLGKRIIQLISNKISVYAAHTNLDMADGGTNDELFNIIGLINKQPLMPEAEGIALGRVGDLPGEMTLKQFAMLIKERLNLPGLSVTGDLSRIIKKVGLATGSCSNPGMFAQAKKKGCDCYISGDLTYHNAQAALDEGLAFIDATHYGTEVIIVDKLCKLLTDAAKEENKAVEVISSKKSQQPIYIM